MIRLGVNIDHVATLRQARRGREPEPVIAAGLAEIGGADQITIHLREDRRHIQDRDLRILRETVQTRLNLEMSVAEEVVKIAEATVPDLATLVPERREEVTTEGGLNVFGQLKRTTEITRRLMKKGIQVSHFIDADPVQVRAAAATGAAFIEFHTGCFANARGDAAVAAEIEKLHAMAELAVACGLRVNAGHGLNYLNVASLVTMSGIEEFNIGHSIMSRAIFVGLERAVAEMKTAIREGEDRRLKAGPAENFPPSAPKARRKGAK